MIKEIPCWKCKFTHYRISSTGRVYSIRHKIWVKPYWKGGRGKIKYMTVGLWCGKERMQRYLHVLVAEIFLNHTRGDVHHKDFNRRRNGINNLTPNCPTSQRGLHI